MTKPHTLTGSIFITLSIILGALGAHSLGKIISSDLLETFETGVKYLTYSGFGLLILGINSDKFKFSLSRIFQLITIGTILFSGNIFLYIFHEHIPTLNFTVHLVPIGGVLMILGWSIFSIKLFKLK